MSGARRLLGCLNLDDLDLIVCFDSWLGLIECFDSWLGLLGVATEVVGLELSPSDREAKLGVFCLRFSLGVMLSARGIARNSGLALAHTGNSKVAGPIIPHALPNVKGSSRIDLSFGSILSVSIFVRLRCSHSQKSGRFWDRYSIRVAGQNHTLGCSRWLEYKLITLGRRTDYLHSHTEKKMG